MWISGMNNTSYKQDKGIDLSHNQYFTVPRYTFAPYYSDGTVESIDGTPRMLISYPIIEMKNTNKVDININTTTDKVEEDSNEGSSPYAETQSSTRAFKGVVVAAISFDVANSILKKQASSSSEVARNSVILLDKKGDILLSSEDDYKTSHGRNIFEMGPVLTFEQRVR
jgi:hypothetical protein